MIYMLGSLLVVKFGFCWFIVCCLLFGVCMFVICFGLTFAVVLYLG